MATVLTIGGSAVSMSLFNAYPVDLNLRFSDGYSTLGIQRRGGKLAGLPDPWLGKRVSLSIGGTTYFQGDVTDADPHYENVGWVTKYQCRDLRARCDRVPFTDANTLTDTAAFNLQADDLYAIISRQGRNVGQIIQAVLTMTVNATNLSAKGVGNYATLTPPTLPTSTLTDLSLLTIIPPTGVYVQGEKLIGAIASFVRFWAPNHMFWIQPQDGAIRILDKRTFTNSTLRLGTDPISPTPIRRAVGDCFQRVVVRGQPIAERKIVSTKDGTLDEDFAWGSFTNAQAKANWKPTDNTRDLFAKSNGTCTCTDTLNVVVTSSDGTQTWTSNFWDQTATGHLGTVDLIYSVGSGLNWVVSRRIVSNTAMSAGGTSTLTLDLALPATNYDHYKLYGLSNGSGLVWKKYKVHDTVVGAAMARMLTYPGAWVGANGDVGVMTSYPMGSVCWSTNNNPPYQEWASGITCDPGTGNVYFLVPTFITAGFHVPSDVRALLAINTGNLTATYPPDSGGPVYAGTSNTIEGMTETLTCMVDQWRDPINQTAMVAFAHDILDSVKDAIIEGGVTYHGYYGTALTPGQAISVTGTGYTTGWEGLALPILEVNLTWNCGNQTQFTTTMMVSNRRAHHSSAAFLRPSRAMNGQVFGLAGTIGAGYAAKVAGAMGGLQAFGQDMGSVAGFTAGGLGQVAGDVMHAGLGTSGQTQATLGYEAERTAGNLANQGFLAMAGMGYQEGQPYIPDLSPAGKKAITAQEQFKRDHIAATGGQQKQMAADEAAKAGAANPAQMATQVAAERARMKAEAKEFTQERMAVEAEGADERGARIAAEEKEARERSAPGQGG